MVEFHYHCQYTLVAEKLTQEVCKELNASLPNYLQEKRRTVESKNDLKSLC